MAATVVKLGKSMLFGTMPRGDKSTLAWKKELAPISMGFLKFQTDKAAKNIKVSSNSNSDKDNCHIQSDLVAPNSDTNLKLVDNMYIYHESENYDQAKNHVAKIFESSLTTKPSQHSFSSSETEARNFEIPFEKLLDIQKGIEMESLFDVTIENPKLKIASIRSWKRFISVNVYYVMGFRPNQVTCIAHLYLYYTLLVPYTYASYIKALMYIL